MKTKRPLTPAFINKLDEYLLLNKPDTWSTRAHGVVYYGALFAVALAVIGFLVPNDPRNDSTIEIWTTLVSILSVIGLIVWLIYLLRFNVFKRFGVVSPGDRIKTFGLYFLSIGTMVLLPYIPGVVETSRANMAYSYEEITNDANDINVRILQLERDSISLSWRKDTFLVRNDIGDLPVYQDSEGSDVIRIAAADYVEAAYQERKIIDTANLKQKLAAADSFHRINDSLYVFFECPEYQYVTPYHYYAADTNNKLFSSVELYNRVLKNYKPVKDAAAGQTLRKLLNKYKTDKKDFEDYSGESKDNRTEGIRSKYVTSVVSMNMNNILEKKDRWAFVYWDTYARVFFYTTFCLAMLVFVFRHTTTRVFFLTLLTLTLLAIITGVLMALFRTSGIAALMIILLYYMIFLVLAIRGVNKKTSEMVSGIALNISFIALYFIPLLLVGLFHLLVEEFYRHQPDNYIRWLTREEKDFHLLCAEIAGLVIFLVCVELIFKRLYRKWYALPEN
jgi:hypothetical protein